MDERISNFSQVASIRRYLFTDGVEKGLEVLDCDNGKIRFLLNVSKALDIMQLYHEGQNMSFVSKNGFTAREIDFLRRFEGGMLYTCGLDSLGGREGFELHGTLHNTPAKVVRAECDEEGIFVEAHIRDSALFGKNLLLKRVIRSAIGSGEVCLEDTLVNEGFADENYCVLYHVNAGYPMLDEGAMIEADAEEVVARNEWAKAHEAQKYVMSAPKALQDEMCYFHKLKTGKISLLNRKIGKKFTVTFSKDTLPNLVEWKCMASGEYVLGLEPCTTWLDHHFTYKTIKAGEKIHFSVALSVDTL